MRDIVFVSHANPEDNEFALWLSLRLAAEGYPVWCDLTKLLGGEDFWKDIEDVLRERTVKYLYVLSRTSNIKPGALEELAVARIVARTQKIRDFIIPLHIDDLPHSEVNINLARLNSISFEGGWAGGFARLLKKLDEDGVQKSNNFNPTAVSNWWKQHYSAEIGLESRPETLVSNWFRISHLPDTLYVHVFQPGYSLSSFENAELTKFPTRQYSNGFISFANRDDLTNAENVTWKSQPYKLQELLSNKHKSTFIDAKETKLIMADLFRQAWESKLAETGLSTYELASSDKCGYFIKDQVEKDTIKFSIGTLKGRRHVLGFKTTNKENDRKRYWHFGISGRVFFRSLNYLAVNPHVLFSDDGHLIWTSKDRMHKAKMRQCSNWWNDDWRDRILAVMSYLSDDDVVRLQLARKSVVEVNLMPEIFTSPVLFHDPIKSQDKEDEIRDEEEDEQETEDL
jgi:hypothetical protein